jgi:hypothetical protein
MFKKNRFRLPLAAKVLLAVSLAWSLTSCTVDCTVPDLITAINNANANPAPSTINLDPGCIYTLTAVDNTAFGGTTFEYGDNGLPQITTPITINGNNATIIRASGAPDFRFFYITDTGELTLNDLTLDNGFANRPGSAFPSSGGAIYNNRCYLEVNNSNLQENQATSDGGAIFAIGGATTHINGSTITDNNASDGGGIFLYEGKLLSVDNSEISNNSAINSGGGINIGYGAELIVNDSHITSNHAGRRGGGIFKNSGWSKLPTTITGTTFKDNIAEWSGGGVYILRTPLTISDSQFSGNQAGDYGGGLGYHDNSSETVLVTGTTFDNNIALLDGGAINFSGELMTVNGSTIRNNTADNGAGIHNGPAADTTLTLTSSTLQENVTTGYGGGVFNEGVMVCEESTFIGNDSAAKGGGIHNTGEMEVLGCAFDKNTTGLDGGGISNENIADIEGSHFNSNNATRGGGLSSRDADTEINQSTFTGNMAKFQGGAIFNLGAAPGSSQMDILSCEITDNTAPIGGGIASSLGDTTISDSTITSNKAMKKEGGGIYNDGYMRISGSIISGNEASTLGGGIHNIGEINVQDSTFEGNLASADGGGINTYSIAKIYGSTFVGNTAFRGGGLASVGGDTTLTNNTFSANTAKDSGGGLFNMGPLIGDTSPGGAMQASHITVAYNSAPAGGGIAASGGSLQIKNSIVALNPAGSDCIISAAGLSAVGENMDSDDSCAGFTLKDDPLLDILENYGGPTDTHALKTGSPAMNEAPDCTTIGGAIVSVDQRGQSRPGGLFCDLGAYEEESDLPLLTFPHVIFQSTLDCRLEPASSSAAITSFQPNDVAEVVGRNINLTWYQVAPAGLEDLCWVWVGEVEFVGDLDSVEIIPSKDPVEEEKPEEEGEESSPSQPGCTVRNPNGALVCQVPCPPNAVPGDPCTP